MTTHFKSVNLRYMENATQLWPAKSQAKFSLRCTSLQYDINVFAYDLSQTQYIKHPRKTSFYKSVLWSVLRFRRVE